MNLLECLVAIALSMLLLNPLLKTSADLIAKQIEYEKRQLLISEAGRAFELIGRALRMAGYRNIYSTQQRKQVDQWIAVQKKTGYRGSDSLTVQNELSSGIDFDCIGNVLNQERTKNGLARQGFLVDRQASIAKGAKVNGGSLICQSLDRQGRLQNTTLMNGVNALWIEELTIQDKATPQKIFKVSLQMTDGASLNIGLERTFSTRNLP
jgi:type II secretory pathway component PulJ